MQFLHYIALHYILYIFIYFIRQIYGASLGERHWRWDFPLRTYIKSQLQHNKSCGEELFLVNLTLVLPSLMSLILGYNQQRNMCWSVALQASEDPHHEHKITSESQRARAVIESVYSAPRRSRRHSSSLLSSRKMAAWCGNTGINEWN